MSSGSSVGYAWSASSRCQASYSGLAFMGGGYLSFFGYFHVKCHHCCLIELNVTFMSRHGKVNRDP